MLSKIMMMPSLLVVLASTAFAGTTYQYDAFSRMSRVTLSNGVTTVYQYDQYNGLVHLNHYQSAACQKLITGFGYRYNQDGNIQERIRTNGSGQQATEKYAYDAANNLKDYTCTGALCPRDDHGAVIASQHYTFDALNNIKRIDSNNTITTYTYDSKFPTRMLGYQNSNAHYPSNTKLAYDHDGNMTEDDQGNAITYSPFDQAYQVMHLTHKTTYFYNGDGVQVGEVTPAHQTTYFLYGRSHLLTMRGGASPQQTTSFIYGAFRLGLQMGSGEGLSYDLMDQNHNVVNTLTQRAKQPLIVNSYAYSPYGVESNLNKSSNDQRSIQYFGFDGQLTDGQTHWQFLGKGYRAYNPMIRRFMSQDTLSPFDKGGVNGYLFGSNNPMMLSDPTGHFSELGFGEVMTGSFLLLGGVISGMNVLTIAGMEVAFNGVNHMLSDAHPHGAQLTKALLLDTEAVGLSGVGFAADLAVISQIGKLSQFLAPESELGQSIIQRGLLFAWSNVDFNIYTPYENIMAMKDNPKQYFGNTLFNWALGMNIIESDLLSRIFSNKGVVGDALRLGVDEEKFASVMGKYNQPKQQFSYNLVDAARIRKNISWFSLEHKALIAHAIWNRSLYGGRLVYSAFASHHLLPTLGGCMLGNCMS